MRTLTLVAAFGMPLSIFLLLGWKLVVRLRLERQGRVVHASVTSVRNWTDSLDGIKQQTVSYQFSVGNDYYSAAADVPVRGKGYYSGDRLPVMYVPSRPAKAQPVTGGLATSTGLTAFVMVAMVALMLWMLTLLR
jgi:hypothetical protein